MELTHPYTPSETYKGTLASAASAAGQVAIPGIDRAPVDVVPGLQLHQCLRPSGSDVENTSGREQGIVE